MGLNMLFSGDLHNLSNNAFIQAAPLVSGMKKKERIRDL